MACNCVISCLTDNLLSVTHFYRHSIFGQACVRSALFHLKLQLLVTSNEEPDVLGTAVRHNRVRL